MVSDLHGNGILHNDMLQDIELLEQSITSEGYNEDVSSNFFKTKVNESLQDGTRNDTQPDIFYFNVFGIQGKFVFDKSKKIVSLNNDNFKYSYSLDSDDDTLLSFTITDTQGVQYVFSEREYSETEYEGGIAWSYINSRSLRQREIDYSSSWHLTSVTAPNSRTMHFQYQDETLTYEIRNAVMGKICDTEQCEDSNVSEDQWAYKDVLNNTSGAKTNYKLYAKKISHISSDTFTVDFQNIPREESREA